MADEEANVGREKDPRISDKRAVRAVAIMANVMQLDRNKSASNYKEDRQARIEALTRMGVDDAWLGKSGEPLVIELAQQDVNKSESKLWKKIDLSKAPSDPLNVEALKQNEEVIIARRAKPGGSREVPMEQGSAMDDWLARWFGTGSLDQMATFMGFGERFADLVFGDAASKPQPRREKPRGIGADLRATVEKARKEREVVEMEVTRQQEQRQQERELKNLGIRGQAEVSRITTAVYSPMGLEKAEECMALIRTISKDRVWMSGPAQTNQALHILDQVADNPDYVDNPSFEGRARIEWKRHHRGQGDREFDIFWTQAKGIITDIAIARFLDKRGALPNWKEKEMTGHHLETRWGDKYEALRLAAIDKWKEIQGQIKKPEDANKYWWVERWQR